MSIYAIVAAVSYLLGSIPFGYILVRVFLKTDIRQTGSGNIGATNVGRTGHKGLAIATLLLDAGKGALAVAVGGQIWINYRPPVLVGIKGGPLEPVQFAVPPGFVAIGLLAALFAVLGHVFPVWLRFKGGKGVATAIGAFVLVAPVAGLISLAVFGVVLGLSRYVSLASIVGAVVFPFAARWTVHHADSYVVLLLTGLTSALVILKHHANIRRLLAGTENKFGSKSSPPPTPLPAEKRA